MQIIEEIITLANKNEGKIFGGYVRDVIIPGKINPVIGADFKDIDIWFDSEDNADIFVKCLKKFYDIKENYGYDVKAGTVNYTFARKQCAVKFTETLYLWIDIVTSDIFPVDDFDVNCFVYYKERFYFERSGLDENETLMAIINKTMTMLPRYKDKLEDKMG